LHDRTRCRALFATHFHGVPTYVAANLPHVAPYCADVQPVDGDESLHFLFRFVRGFSTKSYALHCARMAGVPEEVLALASKIVQESDLIGV
jgi:DNA mismatch repair protein MutS